MGRILAAVRGPLFRLFSFFLTLNMLQLARQQCRKRLM